MNQCGQILQLTPPTPSKVARWSADRGRRAMRANHSCVWNTGAELRFNYSAVGGAVNVATRRRLPQLKLPPRRFSRRPAPPPSERPRPVARGRRGDGRCRKYDGGGRRAYPACRACLVCPGPKPGARGSDPGGEACGVDVDGEGAAAGLGRHAARATAQVPPGFAGAWRAAALAGGAASFCRMERCACRSSGHGRSLDDSLRAAAQKRHHLVGAEGCQGGARLIGDGSVKRLRGVAVSASRPG